MGVTAQMLPLMTALVRIPPPVSLRFDRRFKRYPRLKAMHTLTLAKLKKHNDISRCSHIPLCGDGYKLPPLALLSREP